MHSTGFRKLPTNLCTTSDPSTFQSTVGWTLMNLFPYGTKPRTDDSDKLILADRNSPDAWLETPDMVSDIFAACAFLLENSGALAHFTPYEPKSKKPYSSLWLTAFQHKKSINVGQEWHLNWHFPPNEVAKWWKQLTSFWDYPLNYRAYRRINPTSPGGSSSLNWWQFAFFLFVAADEAAADTGFPPDRKSITENQFAYSVWKDQFEWIFNTKTKNGTYKLPHHRASICSLAIDSDLVCVQPKVMFPVVGGGTRVFSRNLSMLRPRGIVRTQWLQLPQSLEHELDKNLNLLLIPVPYNLESSDFKRVEAVAPISDDASRAFKLTQSWLGDVDSICSLVVSVIKKSMAQGSEPDAIIFPELSLNAETFERIATDAKRVCPTLQFLISGTAQNCDNQRGNFVWTRVYLASKNGMNKYAHTKEDGYFDVSQSKHHRWKLSPAQVDIYDLGSGEPDGLNGNVNYWESVNVRGRELNFLPFRQNSVLTTLICEDLARSEPCHEILRAIGPNLIIALLMDSAQTNNRWGARYASVFAEDHGGSVLTLTSKALVNRANANLSPDKQSSAIAYFRDHNGKEKEIEFSDKTLGVLLRLVPETVNDELPDRKTIDGRSKASVSWVLAPDNSILNLEE